MRGSLTYSADPNDYLSGSILRRLPWRSPCDTVGVQTICHVLPGVSIFPSQGKDRGRALETGPVLPGDVCGDDELRAPRMRHTLTDGYTVACRMGGMQNSSCGRPDAEQEHADANQRRGIC
jgi:hypothetical protein